MFVDRLLAMPATDLEGLARMTAIRKAAYFEISEVADYWAMGNDRDEWPDEKFPCIRPPFPTTWFEYRPSPRLHCNGRVLPGIRAITPTIGYLVQALERKGGSLLFFTEVSETLDLGRPVIASEHLIPITITGEIVTGEVRVVRADRDRVFNETKAREIASRCNISVKEIRAAVEEADDGRRPASSVPVLLALTFLNTVNRQVIDRVPSDRLQRARSRHGKLPVVRYSEIVVPGFANISSAGARGDHASPTLHVVRGHHKRRATGIYWWHPFMRGRYENGITLSRYKAVAP